MVPSVKGVLLLGPVSAIRKAIREGRLTTERVEHALEEPDLIFLEEKVQPTSWYPVEIMGRYLELQASLEPEPRDEVLHEFGVKALYYTQGTNRYRQLNIETGELEGANPTERRMTTRKLLSVWGAFYNFGRFEMSHDDEGKPIVVYLEVEALPEAIRPTIEGFMSAISSQVTGREVRVTSERPVPGRIILHTQLA